MGYTTVFRGSFGVTPTLSDDMINFLEQLNDSRRMKRSIKGYGIEGEFYVESDFGDNVVDHNNPPSTQAGLWCQWRPTDDGEYIEWDGGEKFYNYVEWIFYLVNKILKPNGYVVEGEVEWRGEDWRYEGVITIDDNLVYVNSNLYTVEDYNREINGDIRLDVVHLIDKKPNLDVEETITISKNEYLELLNSKKKMLEYQELLTLISDNYSNINK